MNIAKGSFALSLFGALAWLATSTTGCSSDPTPASVCATACNCDPSYCEAPNDCEGAFEKQGDDAQAAGCDAEYDALLQCYADKLECVEGKVDGTACEQAGVTLVNCISDDGAP